MLERTAASLEPCNLQRVLPATLRPLRKTAHRPQQLQTTFWSHGAPDIELLDACLSLTRLPLPLPLLAPAASSPPSPPPPSQTPSEKKLDSMTASAFLLDFLYPSPALGLLQRLRPAISDSDGSSQRARSLPGRFYTSSIPYPSRSAAETEGAETQRDSFAALEAAAKAAHSETQKHAKAAGADKQGGAFVSDKPPSEISATLELIGVSIGHQSHGDGERGLCQGQDSALDGPALQVPSPIGVRSWEAMSLVKILSSELGPDQGSSYDRIWTLYCDLDSVLKDEYRTVVMAKLAQSSRQADATRVLKLLELCPVHKRNLDSLNAAIDAHLVLQDPKAAVDIFTSSLEPKGNNNRGLDILLAHGLKEQLWSLVHAALLIWRTAAIPGADHQTMTFERVATVPSFPERIQDLYSWSGSRARPDLDYFMRLLTNKSMPLFEQSSAVFILERLRHGCKSTSDYERVYVPYASYIIHCAEKGHKKLAARLYRQYRAFPGMSITSGVFRAMISVHFSDGTVAMEELLRDWKLTGKDMTQWGYQKFLSYYANRGDVGAVKRLAQEYLACLPLLAREDTSLTMSLMHVHAVRGEPEAAREVLDEVAKTMPPPTKYWNVLLNAYARAWMYDEAVKTFVHMFEQSQVDHVSFGTIMGMSGARGDLDFTLDLLRLAKEFEVEPDIAMVDAVVEAYCENDQFSQAEELCIAVTKEPGRHDGCTVLWNTLLHHHGLRRDLDAVNRLLDVMTSHRLPYDNDTYRQLLLALMYCKQSMHAFRLLKEAEKNKTFHPTVEHYMILMSALIVTGEPDAALKINDFLAAKGVPPSAQRTANTMKALHQLIKKYSETPSRSKQVEKARVSLKNIISMTAGQSQSTSLDSAVAPDARWAATQSSEAILILTQMRDFSTVEEIVNLYQSQFPSEPGNASIRMLHAIMLADFAEGNYDKVRATWRIVLEAAKQRRQAPKAGDNTTRILPKFRYDLSSPLKTMQRVCFVEGDASGLVQLIPQIKADGFEVDSKNWNINVQLLAKMKMWNEAFAVCEKQLMPNWTGWYQNRRVRKKVKNNDLPLVWRRLGFHLHRPRPTAHTLLVLAKKYQELDEMRHWSSRVSSALDRIGEQCPRVIHALSTLIRGSSEFEVALFKDMKSEAKPGILGVIGVATVDKNYKAEPGTLDALGVATVDRNYKAKLLKAKQRYLLKKKRRLAKRAAAGVSTKAKPRKAIRPYLTRRRQRARLVRWRRQTRMRRLGKEAAADVSTEEKPPSRSSVQRKRRTRRRREAMAVAADVSTEAKRPSRSSVQRKRRARRRREAMAAAGVVFTEAKPLKAKRPPRSSVQQKMEAKAAPADVSTEFSPPEAKRPSRSSVQRKKRAQERQQKREAKAAATYVSAEVNPPEAKRPSRSSVQQKMEAKAAASDVSTEVNPPEAKRSPRSPAQRERRTKRRKQKREPKAAVADVYAY